MKRSKLDKFCEFWLWPLIILAIGMVLIISGGCAQQPFSRNTMPIKARLTYYSAHEDKYGSHTASGVHAREGTTIAAGPWWHFGERVYVPALAGVVGDGHFKVQDRGTAVTLKRAIARSLRATAEVFDVYLAGSKRYCRRRMVELTKKVGYYTEAYKE
jgi:hypothetical protein